MEETHNIFIERILHNIRVAERETFKELKEEIEIYKNICNILNDVNREFTIYSIDSNSYIRGVNESYIGIIGKGTRLQNAIYKNLISNLKQDLLILKEKLYQGIKINAKKLGVE